MEKMIIFALALTVTAICEDQFLSGKSKRKEENAPNITRDIELKGCSGIVNGKGYSSGIRRLHEEILDFSNYIKPTPIEYEVKTNIVHEISKIVNTLWPFATVETFGSVAYGLFLPMSDVDIAIIGKWEDGVLPHLTLEKALIEKEMSIQGTLKFYILRSVEIPYVKFTDKLTNINVEITFPSLNCKHSAELIQLYSKLYPNLPHLVFVLKQFLSQRDLLKIGTGGINSYALILMIISFLQRQHRWNIVHSHSNLGVLLIEFFELYGRNFNYNTTAIQIRQGGKYIPKNEFQSQMRIIQNNQSYFSNLLAIEDPLDHKRDVGHDIWGVQRIKDEFELAYVILTQEVCSFGDEMKVSDSASILARIIRITDDVTGYRKWIHNKFFEQSVGLTKYACPIS